MIDSVVIEEVSRNDSLNNVLFKFFSNLFIGDIRRVLLRDKDGVNSDGLDLSTVLFIFNSNLNLGIGSHPRAGIVNTDIVEFFDELVAQ